jgi:single-strand DNA-binding protein
MSLNKAMIIGNLGRDPEMRYTPNGQAVTQFTVAVNRNYKGQDGEWQEETEWFRIVVWGQQAERAAENLRKGNKVYIEGRLQTRQWEDQSGQKRYTTELVANQVTNLERRVREGDGGDPGPVGPASRPVRPTKDGDEAGDKPGDKLDDGKAGDKLDDGNFDDLPF